MVTINLGDMRRGMAWRESQAAVLVAYAPTLSMVIALWDSCQW